MIFLKVCCVDALLFIFIQIQSPPFSSDLCFKGLCLCLFLKQYSNCELSFVMLTHHTSSKWSLLNSVNMLFFSNFWPTFPVGAVMLGMDRMMYASPVFWLGLFLIPFSALIVDITYKVWVSALLFMHWNFYHCSCFILLKKALKLVVFLSSQWRNIHCNIVEVNWLAWSDFWCQTNYPSWISSSKTAMQTFYHPVSKHLWLHTGQLNFAAWQCSFSHCTLSIAIFGQETTVWEHPLYSPLLALCDIFMFWKLNINLEVPHFKSVKDIQSTVMTVLKWLLENDLQWCFHIWQRCLNVHMKSECENFEDDHPF